jgi:lipopolysaccharide export system permease protein
MKKLHRLVFQTFLGPFIITLVISNFLLLMIWMVKYLEDIIGKGLEFSIILEMMGRGALNQIPFSLPLAMLLSSTMTFGKLGETVELIAMKSLGISLQKAMNPLLVFAVMITIGAFFFTNNYLPYSNKKLKTLVSDIRISKPELLIPEGVFYNQLRGYTIRIGKKYKDKSIADVLIFDDSNDGMDGFIAADSGNMALSTSGKFLILNLINGNTYRRDREKVKPGKKKKIPYVRNKFKTNQILFDLSGFKFEKTSPSDRGKSTRNMNIKELSQGIDSLNNKRLGRLISARKDLDHKYFFRPDTIFQYD